MSSSVKTCRFISRLSDEEKTCFYHSERGMTGIEKPLVLPNHCTFQLDLNKRLLNAANEGSLTKVRALLTEGASVNFCDADGKEEVFFSVFK